MRSTTWYLAGLLLMGPGVAAGTLGCGSDATKPGDVALDATTDATTEVEPDTTPDSAPDTTPDIAPETTPDSAPDTTTPDTAPDSEEEVGPPGPLTIARGDRCNALTPFDAPALPFSDEGDTASASDDYIYTTGSACGGAAGQGILGDASPDLVYAFTPSISATYQIAVTPTGDFDPGLMVTDACPPIGEDGFAGLRCVGVSDQGEGTPELVRVDLVQGRTYFLLVDGWSNDTAVSGSFTLSIAIGEDCDDGRDNDNNLLVDCADTQCASDPRCDEASYDGGCDNDSDDDGDGKTDCADPDCDGTLACNEATGGCDNDLDDEGDGRTDCADPDCATAANCDEATYDGGCDNASDDDGDGKVDCEDADCGRAIACLTLGETCATAIALSLDVPTPGTTNGRLSDYGTTAASCNVSAGFSNSFGLAAPDAAFTFTPATTGKYLFETVGDFDDALTVTSDCAFGGGTCFGVERGGTGGERLVVDLDAGVAVFVIVDGWSNTSTSNSGDFTLTVRKATGSTVELICDDQADNDGDGDVDCADSDCAFDRDTCVESGNCGDAVDNDGDEDIDCDDLDCRSDIVACPPPVGDNCATPVVITRLEAVTNIDTCDFGVDFLFADTGSCKVPTFESPDGVVAFMAPSDGMYLAEVESDDMDSVVNAVVAQVCPGASVTTCDAADDTFGLQKVSFSLSAGETVWLLVSAYGDDWFEEPACGTVGIKVFEVDPEVCDDELDNDRDDALDCDDPDCAEAPNCNELQSGPTGCSDGVDNDNDRLIDCFDVDCAGGTACPNGIPGDTCAGALAATGEVWTTTVNTCNYTGDFKAEEVGGCQSTSSTTTPKDVVVAYTAPVAGDYRVVFDPGFGGGSSFDALLNVVKGASCPTSPLRVCAGGSDQGDPEGVTVSATAGETFWVIGGGWSSGCGLAQVAVSLIGPEVCDDGVDNDADGKLDCADSECAAFPVCIEVCNDQKDNDLDGATDCKDTQCVATPFCSELANGANACGDGLDNDGNGLSDCYDGTCLASAACPNGGVADTCTGAPRIDATTWSDTFGTCAYTSNYAQSSSGQCRTMGAGGDVVVQFVAPAAGTYRVAYTTGLAGTSTFDTVINVVKAGACPSGSLASCASGVDDGASSTPIESLKLVAAAGESFWIIADAYGSGCGTTKLEVSLVADEVCDDRVDNDADDLTDCADRDCRTRRPDLCPTPAGDTCGDSSLPIVTLPFSDATRTTCDYTQDYEGDDELCYGYNSAEVVYRYTATRAITVQGSMVSLDVDDIDLVLSAASACPSEGILTQCLDTADDASNGPEQVQVSLAAGETVYFVGAPYFSGECTTYLLEVNEVP